MKNIVLALLLSGIVSSTFAQTWVTSAPNIYYNSGNVGIGTATPSAALDVNGAQHLNGNLTFSNDLTEYFIHGPANGGAIRIRSNGGATTDRDLQFGIIDNNGTWYSLMTVGNNSNVGIGTTSPGYKLDVEGGSAYVNLDNLAALGGQLTISNGYGNEYGAVRLNLNNGGAVSWIKGLVTGPNTNTGSAMVFGVPSNTSDGTEAMRITSNGSLAIGTTDPLSYKLAVNGSAIATSVTVKLYANWPDYVFKKGYQLPSLTEVKAYIDQHQHLPEMPSEQEIKTDGLNLGEMNKRLNLRITCKCLRI